MDRCPHCGGEDLYMNQCYDCGEYLDDEDEGCADCGEYECVCDDFGGDEDYDWMDDRDSYPEYDDIDFADPGGRSALRAATIDNPRNLSCPTCGEPNRLTPADRERGYQCDECADRVERGGY